MDKALSAYVPGLGKTTIKDVLHKLKMHGCVCLPYGGAVRDQFLGKDALDIDADTPCELDKVVDICKRYWDAKYCKAPPKWASLKIVHIGELSEGDGEEMDLANWNTTFFGSLTNLEYTTNSLGYYEDKANDRGIIVDLPGTGVEDTCNKWIRIPVPSDQWQDWYNGDNWKIVRYWKLRAKGYTAQNDALPKFIKKTMMEILSTSKGEKFFKTTYCKYALSGNISNATCLIPSSVCEDRDKLRDKYYALYEEVLGEFWEEKAKPLLDKLNVECAKPE